MTFTFRDLAKLRWQLIATLLLLGLAGALAFWSHQERQRADAAYQIVERNYRQSEARLRQVNTEEQEIKDKAALFNQLTASALIGEEKRLDWTEQLRALQQRLHLPKMEYEFAPQALASGGESSQFVYVTSPLKLSLHVLHEGDLLTYLNDLQQHAKALVVVRTCTLARIPEGAQERATTLAQLTAQCELDWLTAKPGSGGKP